MAVNRATLDLIESFESCSLAAYQDIAGVWTIGWGHTRGVYPGMTMTLDQADETLLLDIGAAEVVVQSRDLVCTENEYGAMVSLCFNIGAGNFIGSTVLRDHEAGNKAAAANAFLLWDKAHVDGQLVVVAGLLRRRKAERGLYLT